MKQQLYQNSNENLEVNLSDTATRTFSFIHPISKVQIVTIPELTLTRGSNWEAEVKDNLRKLINRRNTDEIVGKILENSRAYLYSYQQ